MEHDEMIRYFAVGIASTPIAIIIFIYVVAVCKVLAGMI